MEYIPGYNIDFVILWVDGNDPEWQRKKQLYINSGDMSVSSEDANANCRYHGDEELLRFWFRGVEENASWVHKIYFISAGQVPTWLERKHHKLEIVNHEDFIPKEYLPTFNSHTIQLNLHRISSLSEHFVLFDDDMFLIRKHSPEDYFKEGYPVLGTYLGFINLGYSNWHRMIWNATAVINEQFNVHESIWKFRSKWFNIRELGVAFATYNLLCYLVNKIMPVHFYGHLPYPHLKSTFVEAWSVQYKVLHDTSIHKFRSDEQVIHYLLCAWNQLCGRFYPAPIDPPGKWYSITSENLESICDAIRNRVYPVICINDSIYNVESGITSRQLASAFSEIFSKKSSFEK